METNRRSLASALLITLAASVPLVFVPLIGPIAAAWVGGRKAGRGAVTSGCVAAVVWGLILWALSAHEANIGGTQVSLGPLSFLIPATCGGFLAGGLLACGGRTPVTVGIVVVVASAIWSGGYLQRIVGLVNELRPEPVKQEAIGGESCPEHLQKLYTAAMLYTDSWDGKLPPADKWEDALRETIAKPEYLNCPKAGAAGHGYAMNEALGGQDVSKVSDAASTVLFYDSSLPGPNAHDKVASLPRPGRHDGQNYAVYADGHTAPIAAR